MNQGFYFKHTRCRYDLLVVADTQERAKDKFEQYLTAHPAMPKDEWSMSICGRIAPDIYTLAFVN